MAPTLYEWQGIKIQFYSNDHEPIHFHCLYAEYESICEFLIDNGKIVDFKWRYVEGATPLPAKQLKMALRLIKKYKFEIIEKWTDFYIWHKQIKLNRINTKKP